jgi:hypothetical protein
MAAWRSRRRSDCGPLEDENAKLKRLLAEAVLDNAGLKDLLAKLVTPAAKREAVAQPRRMPKLSQNSGYAFS